MSRVKAVVFDVYKTLIDITSDEGSAQVYEFLSLWLSYKGLTIGSDDLKALYRKLAEAVILSNPQRYPDIDILDVFASIIARLAEESGQNVSSNQNHLAKELGLLFRILTTDSLEIYDATVPLLEALERNYRLAVLSNTQRLFTVAEFKRFGIEKFFEFMVFSSDVGASKPNPMIFQKLLELMDIRPEDVVYVGDNLFDDIWGAQQAGINTVWLDRGLARCFPDKFEVPVPGIHLTDESIGELPELLHVFD